jgi:hypothetical protein
VPEISRFYGIVIKMFHYDHAPPHFHAEYGDSAMLIAIETLGVIAGELPPRATGMVMEWAAAHQDELRLAWENARAMEPLGRIAPLA